MLLQLFIRVIAAVRARWLLMSVVCVVPLLSSATLTAQSIHFQDLSTMRGANYVPSYAKNDVAIWLDFDAAVIDRELGYAERLRLNTVRVFLSQAVYERNPQQFLERLENFLAFVTSTNCKPCSCHSIPALIPKWWTCRITATRAGCRRPVCHGWASETGQPWTTTSMPWWADIGMIGALSSGMS